MTSSTGRTAAAVLLVLLAFAPSAPAAPTPEQIDQWIKELGDNRFSVREKASQQLWAAGRAAEPALKEAVRSSDAEVVLRARAILDKFKWGIFPDTPPQVIDLIGQYRSGAAANKQTAVQGLLKLGKPGVAVVTRIADAESNPADRASLFQFVTQEASRAAGALLPKEEYDALEALLEACLVSDTDLAHSNYAVYLMLRGRLDAMIPTWRERAEKADGRAAETLAHLYRLKGDLPNALGAAEKSGKANLVELLLSERGEWKAVAAKDVRAIDTRELKTLGLRATYHRLAGNRAAFDQLIAEIRKHGDSQPANSAGLQLAAEMLLLNGRVAEAEELLLAKGPALTLTCELLCQQLRFREALALAEKPNTTPERVRVEARRGRIYHQLGDRDKAQKIFAALAEEIKKPAEGRVVALYDRSPECDLVKVELQLGLRDQALEHFALLLTRSGGPNTMPRLWEQVFPKEHDLAQTWWKFLRQHRPQDAPAAAMRRVQDLLRGKVPAKDLAALVQDADQAAARANPPDKEALLLAVGDACQAAGQDAQAQTYFTKAVQLVDTPTARIRLGDFLAEKKQWKEAAQVYRAAWESDPGLALALYLHGWALTQGGEDAPGQKAIELAAAIPLGNDTARYTLTEELDRRGLADLLLREREFVAKTGWRRSVQVGNTLVRLSPMLEARKDYLRSAAYTQEQALVILRNNIYFTDPIGYLSMPHRVHRQQARAHLSEGRIDEALEEGRRAEAIAPGNLALATNLIPELEKRDRKKEADDLYVRTRAPYEQLLKDHPDSAFAHNALAWLDARCRKSLDAALEHARKAAELDPGKPTYLDTLAEVHFQRGDKAKAIDLMKQCLALEPKNENFPKRLQRFESGDPSREVP